LQSLGLRIENPDFAGTDIQKQKGRLDGLTIVITGTLPKAREEVEDLIERNGGHASSSLSGNTDYLIVGENPGSKLQKARSLGVTTISYDDFLMLIEHGKSGEIRSNKLF
jgi:DNA ligase (NAD+)